MRRAIAVLVVLSLPACGGGGGSPTSGSVVAPAPSPTPAITGWPAGTTLELVDGGTGQPIQGQVSVAGTTVQAGAPLASAAAEGSTVEVSVPGFLTRQTLVRTGDTRLVLWPDSAKLPGDYTCSLVYTSSDGLDPMRRLATRTRTVAVVPSPEIESDPDAMDAHRAAIDAINGTTTLLGVTYRLGGTGDVVVPTKVDRSAGSCAEKMTRAFASLWVSGANEITRAEITFCTSAIAATLGTVSHELGHTIGLRHSRDARDMMYPYSVSSSSTTPTGREVLTMHMMRARRPGTLWPDNDREANKAAGVRLETVID